jgi:hypothetical protein
MRVLRRFYLAGKNLTGNTGLPIVLLVDFKRVAMTALSGETPAKMPGGAIIFTTGTVETQAP